MIKIESIGIDQTREPGHLGSTITFASFVFTFFLMLRLGTPLEVLIAWLTLLLPFCAIFYIPILLEKTLDFFKSPNQVPIKLERWIVITANFLITTVNILTAAVLIMN